jgi:hypothetical protein
LSLKGSDIRKYRKGKVEPYFYLNRIGKEYMNDHFLAATKGAVDIR